LSKIKKSVKSKIDFVELEMYDALHESTFKLKKSNSYILFFFAKFHEETILAKDLTSLRAKEWERLKSSSIPLSGKCVAMEIVA